MEDDVERLALVSLVLFDRSLLRLRAENERLRLVLRLARDPPSFWPVWDLTAGTAAERVEAVIFGARAFGLQADAHTEAEEVDDRETGLLCTDRPCHFSARVDRHGRAKFAIGALVRSAATRDSPDVRKLDDFLWLGKDPDRGLRPQSPNMRLGVTHPIKHGPSFASAA